MCCFVVCILCADPGLPLLVQMVAHDVDFDNGPLLSNHEFLASKRMISVEVRGSRTSGILPTSVVLHLPAHSTVHSVKAQLEGCTQAPGVIAASQIKLVYAGRALSDDETLSFIDTESSTPGQITVHAVLLAPERSAAPTPVKVGSVPCSPIGPSPLVSPRYHSSQGGSVASSPGLSSTASPGSTQSNEWLEGLKREVELCMRTAFYDLIEKALSEEQPDAEWISRLYAEMRDKLCALTPRRADMHQDIHEALDVNHFEHMVRHKAFDPADLSKLVAFAFGRLQSLCSPSRDAEVQQVRAELQGMLEQSDLTFSKWAVAFLKGFHATIDDIEQDVAEFKKNMTKPPSPPESNAASGTGPGFPGCGPFDSPAASGGVREIKARLKHLGVSDVMLNNCVEKHELEHLLESATARVSGTVSGGITHPSLLNKDRLKACRERPAPDDRASPAARSTSASEAAAATAGAASNTRVRVVPVSFRVMVRASGAAPLDKTMLLPPATLAAHARAEIAKVCGISADQVG